MQMRSLINEFDNKSGAMLITTDDLDGFWDMLLLQVIITLILCFNAINIIHCKIFFPIISYIYVYILG